MKKSLFKKKAKNIASVINSLSSTDRSSEFSENDAEKGKKIKDIIVIFFKFGFWGVTDRGLL